MARLDSESHPRQDRPYRVLRYGDFRLIWSAELVSQIGTHIQRVAVALQAFEMTGDPLQLGLLGLARFIPHSSSASPP